MLFLNLIFVLSALVSLQVNCLLIQDDDAMKALSVFARDLDVFDRQKQQSLCTPQLYGSGWGGHFLCDLSATKRNQQNCWFLSVGISHDYSFDTHLSQRHRCKGFAMDPTVDQKVAMSPGVVFLKMGANSPGFSRDWAGISVPAFRKWLGRDLSVLKMGTFLLRIHSQNTSQLPNLLQTAKAVSTRWQTIFWKTTSFFSRMCTS